MVDINLIKKLRQETSISLAKCKEALEEAEGDIEKAKEILKRRGILDASKKADKATENGIVEAYIHNNRKVGVLVKLACQTDFVARNEFFQELAHNIAMHIAAMNPEYISKEDIPQDLVAKLKQEYEEEFKNSGKPEEIVTKMVEGKIEKRFAQTTLLSQQYIKDPSMTVEELIKTYISKLGENIAILDFVRFEI